MWFKVSFAIPQPEEVIEATDWRVKDGFAEFYKTEAGEPHVVKSHQLDHVLSVEPVEILTPAAPTQPVGTTAPMPDTEGALPPMPLPQMPNQAPQNPMANFIGRMRQ